MNLERFKLGREAQRITRFHIMPTNEYQSVGAHSFGVALIILELYDGTGDPVNPDLIKAALYHDIAEARVGDVPSPTFRQFPELGKQVKLAEEAIDREYGLEVKLTENEQRMLKLADKFELAMFSCEEFARGNRRAMVSLTRVLKYLEDDCLCITANEYIILDHIRAERNRLISEFV